MTEATQLKAEKAGIRTICVLLDSERTALMARMAVNREALSYEHLLDTLHMNSFGGGEADDVYFRSDAPGQRLMMSGRLDAREFIDAMDYLRVEEGPECAPALVLTNRGAALRTGRATVILKEHQSTGIKYQGESYGNFAGRAEMDQWNVMLADADETTMFALAGGRRGMETPTDLCVLVPVHPQFDSMEISSAAYSGYIGIINAFALRETLDRLFSMTGTRDVRVNVGRRDGGYCLSAEIDGIRACAARGCEPI